MARERNPHVPLLSGTLLASVALIAPIALWVHLGDGNPLRTGAVVLAALLLCAAAVRRAVRRYTACLLFARALRVASAAPCRSADVHRSAAPRDRRNPSSRPCGPSRCCPLNTSRGPRDMGCRGATFPLERRRSARRRTRP